MSALKRRPTESSDSLDSSYSLKHCCSSLRVNLSYVSDHSNNDDSDGKTPAGGELSVEGEATTTAKKKVNPRVLRVENINLDLSDLGSGGRGNEDEAAAAGTSCKTPSRRVVACEKSPEVSLMDIRDQELSRSCSELKGIILSKTFALFDEKNAFSIKTSRVFDDNNREKGEPSSCASPSVKVCIGNDEEVLMSDKDSSPVKVFAKNFTLTTPPTKATTTKEKPQAAVVTTSQALNTPKSLSPTTNKRTSQTPKKRLFGDENRPSQLYTESGSPILSGQVRRRSRLSMTQSKYNRDGEDQARLLKNSLMLASSGGEVSSNRSIYRQESMDLTEVQGVMPLNEKISMLFKKNSQSLKKSSKCHEPSGTSLRVNTSIVTNSPKSSGDSKDSVVAHSRESNNSCANASSSLKVNTSLDRLTDSNKQTETRESSISINLENPSNGGNQGSDSGRRSSIASFVATTPYPMSRSQLYKTRFLNAKYNNTSQENLSEESSRREDQDNNRSNMMKTVTISDDTSDNSGKRVCSKTIAVSDDSAGLSSPLTLDPPKSSRIIEDSSPEDSSPVKQLGDGPSASAKSPSTAQPGEPRRRKLYSLDNDEIVSFSPLNDSPKPVAPKKPRKAKKFVRKELPKKVRASQRLQNACKDKNIEQPNEGATQNRTQADGSSLLEVENDVVVVEGKKTTSPVKKTVKTKKPRKVVSKKIVIKPDVLKKLRANRWTSESSGVSNRGSSGEFFQIAAPVGRRTRRKIVIVVTGLSKEDRDVVRSAVKSLGNCKLEANVTRNTTHIVSKGLRTISLLQGITRGCWIVSMNWVVQSMEQKSWLQPEQFEMGDLYKAVQENRKDRQKFGQSYVSDLFTACGLIYVESNTQPPTSTLRELIKLSGGWTTEDPGRAKIIVGGDYLKELWVLDSITTGELQPIQDYYKPK